MLARSARVKMIEECRRPDMDLRHVCLHANFLDNLKSLTLQAQMQIVTEKAAPRKQQKPKSKPMEVVCEHIELAEDDEDDDSAMTFQSISYSSPKSTVSIISCDEEDDSNSDDSSDSEDGEPLQRYTRPTPQPIMGSKPIDIPQAKISVTAVEVY